MNNKKNILTMLLLLLSGSIVCQNITPKFELVYDHGYNSPDVFEKAYELESGDYLISYANIPLYWGGWIYSNSIQGLLKISADGAILTAKDYPIVGYTTSQPHIFFTESHGTIMVGVRNPWREKDPTCPYYDPDVKDGRIYFSKINDELDIIYNKDYSIQIDTTFTEKENRLNMFYANDDGSGIWAAIHKSVSATDPFPGTLGNDSLLFYKFDYEGNIIDKKHMELFGWGNNGFYLDIVTHDENGYNIFVTWIKKKQEFNPNNPNAYENKFGLIRYDNDFNLIEELYRSSNNPDYYISNSVCEMSDPRKTLISSNRMCFTDEPNYDFISLSVIDNKELKFDKQIQRTTDYLHYMGLPTISAVDYIDENKIFWAFVEHYNSSGYDSWATILVLNSDMEVEQEIFYDYGGEKTNMFLRNVKATQDGGLLITGYFLDFVNEPDLFHALAVKFPAEAFVSVEEAHAHGLRAAVAYPNPGNNTLNIRTSLKDSSVEVYDISGRKVFSQEINDNITSISTETWNTGMYMWRIIQNGKAVESGKWMKK